METEFLIKTDEFHGPLEVLLDLIEKRKLHINDISLSQVADEFINHMNSHEDFPMSDSADFILIASTLLLIKSKSLLPNLELTTEEQGNIDDLEKRLELYKKYKEASMGVKEIFGQNPLYFALENKIKPIVFSPTSEIRIESIFESIENVLKSVPKPINLPKVHVAKVISLEEMIDDLSKRVQHSIRMSFKDFVRGGQANKEKADKVTIVVSFLALLELVKQGVVRANQGNHFEDIEIESESIGVPKY
jgi:segregation and condensation protein A